MHGFALHRCRAWIETRNGNPLQGWILDLPGSDGSKLQASRRQAGDLADSAAAMPEIQAK